MVYFPRRRLQGNPPDAGGPVRLNLSRESVRRVRSRCSQATPARERTCAAGAKSLFRPRACHCLLPLQDFSPEAGRYDVIWARSQTPSSSWSLHPLPCIAPPVPPCTHRRLNAPTALVFFSRLSPAPRSAPSIRPSVAPPLHLFLRDPQIQWCIGHLTDDDLIALLRRCEAGLRPGGTVVLKENVCPKGFVVDKEDSSVTRYGTGAELPGWRGSCWRTQAVGRSCSVLQPVPSDSALGRQQGKKCCRLLFHPTTEPKIYVAIRRSDEYFRMIIKKAGLDIVSAKVQSAPYALYPPPPCPGVSSPPGRPCCCEPLRAPSH